jgi:serine/threonine protein kinase
MFCSSGSNQQKAAAHQNDHVPVIHSPTQHLGKLATIEKDVGMRKADVLFATLTSFKTIKATPLSPSFHHRRPPCILVGTRISHAALSAEIRENGCSSRNTSLSSSAPSSGASTRHTFSAASHFSDVSDSHDHISECVPSEPQPSGPLGLRRVRAASEDFLHTLSSSSDVTHGTSVIVGEDVVAEPAVLTSKQTSQVVDLTLASASKILDSVTGYRFERTLQQSLFGQVQLAYDVQRQCHVAIKASLVRLAVPKDSPINVKSIAGVPVLEDVRREARILGLLLRSETSRTTIDSTTCGLSQALLNAIDAPANRVVAATAASQASIQQRFLQSIDKGRLTIARLHAEVETSRYHLLISDYVAGGDLFSVLTSQPQHKVSESVARSWFYQLCCGVRYLHAHSIAHCDLSLENVCLDADGCIRIIDFGLAVQHPHYTGDAHDVDIHSNNITPLGENLPAPSCTCDVCSTLTEALLNEDPAIQACLQSGIALAKLKFLCRPVCKRLHKPGKLGYMSAELFHGQVWDVFAHDILALGVILYCLLAGRPPYTQPDASRDVWFRAMYSGQWLHPNVRSQPPAALYNGLSPDALDLIDSLIKPQHFRPSIDQLMRHAWFHPLPAQIIASHARGTTREPSLETPKLESNPALAKTPARISDTTVVAHHRVAGDGGIFGGSVRLARSG